MEKTAVLVVDMQVGMINDNPYNAVTLMSNIKEMITFARNKEMEVVYIQHTDGPKGKLTFNSDNWKIHPDIAPLDTEKTFEKHYNSAFKETGLKRYLDSRNIENIIVMGLQCEYCIDTTCKVAFEFGYHVYIPKETNSSYDNSYMSGKQIHDFYNQKIWNQRFADVIEIKKLKNKF